jgi:nitrate reductase assembly molybdenum cofactor insertion protein NarJ
MQPGKVSPPLSFDVDSLEKHVLIYDGRAEALLLTAADLAVPKERFERHLQAFVDRAQEMRHTIADDGAPYREILDSLTQLSGRAARKRVPRSLGKTKRGR